LIRQRKVSPIDVVTACLEGIERLQPQINAFITVLSEVAKNAARRWARPHLGYEGQLATYFNGVSGLPDSLNADRYKTSRNGMSPQFLAPAMRCLRFDFST
jgi:hypothetical protein